MALRATKSQRHIIWPAEPLLVQRKLIALLAAIAVLAMQPNISTAATDDPQARPAPRLIIVHQPRNQRVDGLIVAPTLANYLDVEQPWASIGQPRVDVLEN